MNLRYQKPGSLAILIGKLTVNVSNIEFVFIIEVEKHFYYLGINKIIFRQRRQVKCLVEMATIVMYPIPDEFTPTAFL